MLPGGQDPNGLDIWADGFRNGVVAFKATAPIACLMLARVPVDIGHGVAWVWGRDGRERHRVFVNERERSCRCQAGSHDRLCWHVLLWARARMWAGQLSARRYLALVEEYQGPHDPPPVRVVPDLGDDELFRMQGGGR